jgi:hypothetical protein
MKTVVAQLLIAILILGTQSFAKDFQTLNLVCLDTSNGNLKVFEVTIEPELVGHIPENSDRGPNTTGEYLAVVKDASFPKGLGTILYSGNGEFQLKKQAPRSIASRAKT